MPIAFADVPYLRGIQGALNSMLAQQAGANAATIVDAYTASTGKDACKSSGHALGRAAGPGQRGGPVPPQRPR